MLNAIRDIFFYILYFLISIVPTTTYIEGVVGQPQNFLPTQARTPHEKTVSSLIYRGLFKYDIYGSLIPDLVDTWEISEDNTVYTIKLKDNQYWSNGAKINSDDLIYTAFKTPDLQGVATDKVDNLTVRFTLPNRFSPFLSLLTVGLMPLNAEETNNSLMPVSSGPFKILRTEQDGPVIKKLLLTNDDPNKQIKKLVFRYYANDDEIVTAAKLGEIHGFISPKVLELENFVDYKFPLQGIYYGLFFNLRNEKLQDLEFRKKLESSLDLTFLTQPYGIAVQGPISRNEFTNEDLDYNKYDSTLKENNPEPVLELITPDIKVHTDMAKNIKNFWEDRLGIEVSVKTIAADKLNKDIVEPRNFEVLLFGQAVGRDPDRYVNWHSEQSNYPGLNITGFSQVRADRALEEGRNEIDIDKRIIHYDEFQRVIYEQSPAVFLYHPYVNYYINKRITGVGQKATYIEADRFLDFDNWKIN